MSRSKSRLVFKTASEAVGGESNVTGFGAAGANADGADAAAPDAAASDPAEASTAASDAAGSKAAGANAAKAEAAGIGAVEADVARERRSLVRFLGIWSLVGGVVLAAVAVYLLKVLALPVSVAVWTFVFVFCLRGLVNWIEGRGLNRLAATSLAYLVFFAVLVAVGFLLFSPVLGLGEQLADLAAGAPAYVDALVSWGNDLYSRYADVFRDATVENLLNEAGKSLSDWASSLARGGAEGLVLAGSTVVGTLAAVGFALVIAFWILLQLPAIGRECLRVVGPAREEEALFLHRSFTRIMDGYIKGTLLQCVVVGVACAALLAVAGVANAAALGAIAGLLNVVPIIGPWMGGALVVIAALFAGPWTALAVAVGVVLVTHIVYTFVSPKIMQNSVDVHPALVLFALVCGAALGDAVSGLVGSLVGMLAAVPVAALAKSLFVYRFEKRTGRSVAVSDGVFLK